MISLSSSGVCAGDFTTLCPSILQWGQKIVIRITPEFPRDTLYPGDQVFVSRTALHQGRRCQVNKLRR